MAERMIPGVNVNLVDFHSTKGNEMVILNEDGSYTVLINSRLASNKQAEAYRHAIRHIKEDDFQKLNVQEIEFLAHDIKTTT